MKEIKFRAFDKITETCFEFNFADIQEGRVEITDEYEVMQFTGLHDKKRTKEYPEGQPIYEGDIFTCSMEGIKQEHPRFIEDLRSFYESLDTVDSYFQVQEKSIEVIGDAHTTPELLEEIKK